MNVMYLVVAIPVPLVMIIVGALLWKNPPEPGQIGYKSKYAHSSNKAWFFAQVTWGKLSVIHNIASLIGTIAAETAGILMKLDEDKGLILYVAVTTVQCVVIFADIFLTERKLRRFFNSDGTEKN